jgi:hypothetical protein
VAADVAKARKLRRGELVRIVIACAGSGAKWGNYLDVPRHLAPVDGEPLLHRTTRQALTVSHDVHIASLDDDRYLLPGTTRHVIRGQHVNEYASTRHLWSTYGRTLLLYGDVYYTDAAMTTIGGFDGPLWRMFGRAGPSSITGSRWGEIFAGSWLPRHHGMLDDHMHKVALAYAAGYSRRFTAWELLRSIQRTPLNEHMVNPTWFTDVDDETDDFDTPGDYDRHPATAGRVVVGGG